MSTLTFGSIEAELGKLTLSFTVGAESLAEAVEPSFELGVYRVAVARLDRLKPRESLGVCTAYLGMEEHNIELVKAALKAEKAAFGSHFPPGTFRDHRAGTHDA